MNAISEASMSSSPDLDFGTGLGLLLAGVVLAIWGMRGPRNRVASAPRRPRSTAAFIGGLGLSVIALSLMFRALSPTSSPATGVFFRSKGGNYFVTFPTQPRSKESDLEVEGKVLHMTTMRAVGSDGQGEFRVTFTDHPPGSLGPGALEEMKQRMLTGGKVIADRKVTVGNREGLELTIPVNEKNLLGRGRFFVVGDRLYDVVVVGLEDQIMSPQATRFLDSFAFDRP